MAAAAAATEAEAASLRVDLSCIDGAGRGLFATRSFEEGELICVYRGRQLRTATAARLPASERVYLMRLGPQVYVDAADEHSCLARYINDARRAAHQNAYFDKCPEEGVARVRALRQIRCGEEILASYGAWYWVGADRLSAQQQQQQKRRSKSPVVHVDAADTTVVSPAFMLRV